MSGANREHRKVDVVHPSTKPVYEKIVTKVTMSFRRELTLFTTYGKDESMTWGNRLLRAEW